MLLRIVIGLIRIVGSGVRAIRSSSGVFACGVIASIGSIYTVCGVVIHTIPTHTSLFATTKETSDYFRFNAIPTQIAIV